MSNPDKPIGVGSGHITKTGSYSTPEQEVPPSPARPMVRQWATASYDNRTGRAARVADDSYPIGVRHQGPNAWKQVPDDGHHSTKGLKQVPGSRHGRW